jgi:hypothetical protein
MAELRQRIETPALRGAANAWPLEEVSRLHNELREKDDGSAAAPTITAVDTVSQGWWRVHPVLAAAVAAMSVAVLVTVGFAVSFYRQAGTAAARATDAQQQAERAANSADQRIEAARQDASQQIARANDVAAKAQVTSDVLAASDLIRFSLVGGPETARYSGQLLWSRSRGVVFSASRLPAPAQGSIYQLWLRTAGQPVSLGTFVPDASGRATVALDSAPAVPRPVTSVVVTLEPASGRSAPSGPVVLVRPQIVQ